MDDPRVKLGVGMAGVAAAPLLHELDSVRPIVRLAPGLDVAAAGAAAALVSCVRRLFPHTEVDGDARLGPNPWAAETVEGVLAATQRAVPTPTERFSTDFVIAFGDSVSAADLWVAGGQWTAIVARSSQRVEPCSDGAGLHAAAALAAAELSKVLLGRVGFRHFGIGGVQVWNLLTHTCEPAPAHESAARGDDLEIALLGGGSVGSSVAGLIALLPSLRGRAVLVDSDSFDPSRNPYRYPASTGLETGKKVLWLESLLRAAGWDVSSIDGHVRDWVRRQETPGFTGIAISSVDTPEGRLEVADVLARDTLSVGVDGLALHLQRERLGDGFRCPFCDFVDLTPTLGRVAQIAAHCGLRQERVAQILITNEELTETDVHDAVTAGKVHPDSAAALVGRRIEDLQHRAYAEATIKTPAGAPLAVSAPHVSWIAGVLVAAELLKASLGMSMVHRRVDLDMSGIPAGFTRALAADQSRRCVCASPVRRQWMRKLYGG